MNIITWARERRQHRERERERESTAVRVREAREKNSEWAREKSVKQRVRVKQGRTKAERETEENGKDKKQRGFLVDKAETLIKVSDNDLMYTISRIKFTHFIHCVVRFVLLLYSHGWTFVTESCKLWKLFWSVHSTHSETLLAKVHSLIWDFSA